MPSEIRHLLFQPSEVVRAVTDYHRRMQKALPAGSIVSCGPDCDVSGRIVRFRLTVVPDIVQGSNHPPRGGTTRMETAIDGPTLAAALILFCRGHRIPLPAQGEKSLRVIDDQVCLIVAIHARRDSPGAPATQLRL